MTADRYGGQPQRLEHEADELLAVQRTGDGSTDPLVGEGAVGAVEGELGVGRFEGLAHLERAERPLLLGVLGGRVPLLAPGAVLRPGGLVVGTVREGPGTQGAGRGERGAGALERGGLFA